MPVEMKQDNRLVEFMIDGFVENFGITRFVGQEGLSELFEFEVEALSDKPDVAFMNKIGGNCTVKVISMRDSGDKDERLFNGVLTSVDWIGHDRYMHGYRFVIRPWLWLLGHRGTCRIFEQMTVPDILRQVFNGAGFNHHRTILQNNYPTLEYCVQYRESDLNFALRLMEENGIYYYFEHTQSNHELVLIDSKSAHSTLPAYASLKYDALALDQHTREEHVTSWRSSRRFTTGKVAINDYDYREPGKQLLKDHDNAHSYAHGGFESYDPPGRYIDPAVGSDRAEYRLQALQAVDHRRIADGSAPALCPGYTVDLKDIPSADHNRTYLVVRCRHQIGAQSYRSGGDQEAIGYVGTYEFLPSDVQFRAPMTAHKPRIHGSQTARVVGSSTEEIDVDKDGRILVQFHWDRDRTPSRRVRVAQIWAGKKWGGIVTPRIGMEVVVTFLEGDPDEPLVCGCVYNGANEVPYPLPAEKNISGVKSRSTKNATEDDYNEFIFDDTKDAELIRMHAQKDLSVTVEDCETRVIKGKKTGESGRFARWTEIEDGDEYHHLKTGTRTEKIGEGDDLLTISQGNRSCEISMGNDSLKIKMGNRTTKIDLGSDSTEAMQSITLKVAQSKLVIDPTGVTIDAPMITLKGTALIDAKAPITQVNGDAMTIVKGGIVMIN